MPFVRYIAKESIVPGHVLNVQYTLAFSVQRADQSKQILKEMQRALAGNKETLYWGKISTWTVTMEPVPANQSALIEEFLDSTADGQQFSFDPWGTDIAPVREMLCDREDMGYTPRRVTITGDPTYSDAIEYSFIINERS